MNFTISRPTGDINLALPDPSYFIYKFTNTVNDKVYIGSTNNPARRVEEHLTGKGSNALLADLVEYGRSAFTIQLIDMLATSNIDTVYALEDNYIEQFDAITSGYNCRYNREPVPSTLPINLDRFTLRAKFTYASYFSIGMNSLFLEYEKGLAIYKKIVAVSRENVTDITLASKCGYPYIKLKPEMTEAQLMGVEQDRLYDLTLKYADGNLILLSVS